MMMAIFIKIKSLEEMHILLALVEKLAMHACPKSFINSTKDDIEKDFLLNGLELVQRVLLVSNFLKTCHSLVFLLFRQRSYSHH